MALSEAWGWGGWVVVMLLNPHRQTKQPTLPRVGASNRQTLVTRNVEAGCRHGDGDLIPALRGPPPVLVYSPT